MTDVKGHLFWRHSRDVKLPLWEVHLVGLGFYNKMDDHLDDTRKHIPLRRHSLSLILKLILLKMIGVIVI